MAFNFDDEVFKNIVNGNKETIIKLLMVIQSPEEIVFNVKNNNKFGDKNFTAEIINQSSSEICEGLRGNLSGMSIEDINIKAIIDDLEEINKKLTKDPEK